MSDLPQIHDWFFNLLTGGQWTFLYIVLALGILGFSIWVHSRLDEPEVISIGVGLAIVVPPLLFLGILAIGNFISFMIWLWFGGVSG